MRGAEEGEKYEVLDVVGKGEVVQEDIKKKMRRMGKERKRIIKKSLRKTHDIEDMHSAVPFITQQMNLAFTQLE